MLVCVVWKDCQTRTHSSPAISPSSIQHQGVPVWDKIRAEYPKIWQIWDFLTSVKVFQTFWPIWSLKIPPNCTPNWRNQYFFARLIFKNPCFVIFVAILVECFPNLAPQFAPDDWGDCVPWFMRQCFSRLPDHFPAPSCAQMYITDIFLRHFNKIHRTNALQSSN